MDNLFKVDDALSSSRPAVTYRRLLQSSLHFLRSLKDPSVRRSLRPSDPLPNYIPSSLVFFFTAALAAVVLIPLVLVGFGGFVYVAIRPELWLYAIVGIPVGLITLLVVLGIYDWVTDRFTSTPAPMVTPACGPDQPDFICGSRKPGSHLP